MNDKGMIIGLAIALGGILGAAVVESGGVGILLSLINPPAFMIVMGGTMGAVVASFPLGRVTQMGKVVRVAFRQEQTSERDLVNLFVKLADRARREGLLALEGDAMHVEDHAIQKGLMLVVDGNDPELVREIMESDVQAMSERHEGKYAMLEAAGGYAPTMGIIGTVMGLVNVLSHLDKPEQLGHSIAGAFIATLYGILFANVFFLAIAQRLKQRNKEEVARRQLAVEGVLSVQAGDNPRVVREKLEAFLPIHERGEEASRLESQGATAATQQAAA
ncbi:MAG: motility protein A [Chloroflexota bacterium]|nr:motility protein A [Chloroflexota bacterium]